MLDCFKLHPRQNKILAYLLSKKGWIKGLEIAMELGTTDRTVRSDIARINSINRDHGEVIESCSKRGYRINDCEYVKELIKADGANTPECPDERVNYILRKLITGAREVDIFKLAEELMVSESTIESDFKRIKRIVEGKYKSLKLAKKSFCIYLEGSEKEKRAFFSELLFNETNGNYINIKKYNKYFPGIDLMLIQQRLLEVVSKYDFTLNEMAVINLIIHIAITIDRIRNKYGLEMNLQSNEIADTAEYEITRILCAKLAEDFMVEFPDTEIVYITYLIIGKKIIRSTYSNRSELNSMIEPYFIQLTEGLLGNINIEFSLDFAVDDILFIGLCLHIKAMYNRIANGIVLRNPILEDIKKKYPFTFEITVFFANEFWERTALIINDNELGYIALHFGAAIERMAEREKTLKSIAIICSTGYITSNVLVSKLNLLYKDKVRVIGVFSFMELDLIKEKAPDLILTTVPFEHELPIKTVVIDPFLSENDIKKINSVLDSCINNTMDSENLLGEASIFFRENLFVKNIMFQNKGQIINYMAKNMYEEGYVPEDYLGSVLAREKLSSTSIGNLVAIPHAIAMNAHETVISAAILDKPIMWGCHKVQLVFMFAIKSGDRKKLNRLYNHIVRIVDNPEEVNNLLKSESFSDFKAKLARPDLYEYSHN